MSIFKIIACLLTGFSKITVASRYWIAGGAANWNNSANWSNISGGPGGFSVPTVGEDVTFDNLGNGNCSVDINMNVKSVNLTTGYTGNIFQGIYNISTTTSAFFGGGGFTGGTGSVSIQGAFTLSGSIFTAPSGVLEFKSNIAFLGGSFLHYNR